MNIPAEEEIQELHSGICSALADPKRIMILYALGEENYNVTGLAESLHIPQPTASRHLKILRDRGLVNHQREGTNVVYSLADRRLIQALDMLRGVLRRVYTRRTHAIEGD